MNFSFLHLNRKIALVSLCFFALLACLQQSFAGDRKEKEENPFKKRGTTHTTQQSTAEIGKEEGESLIKASKAPRTITLEYVDDLITKAKKGDEKAQEELVGLRHMEKFITPEKTDFLKWKILNSEETLANRCYINDKYAYFVLKHFAQEEIKKHFPKLFTSVQDRTTQKHVGAQLNLGGMYILGKGVQKDEKEAVRLYTLAADQGSPAAQNNLGTMYVDGIGGLQKDEKEAARLYTLAADQGDPIAQNNLATMYVDGIGGLQKDEKEAVRLYTLAADQGDSIAQYNLGIMYETGRGGLQKDALMAIGLYHKSKCQPALENLLPYLTFSTFKSEIKYSDISEINFLDNFYLNTKVLTMNMQKKSLFHIEETSTIKLPENSFSMSTIYNSYKTIVNAGQELEYWVTAIGENRYPGFLITCIKPRQKLLDGYKEDTEGEKAGFCRIDVDGQFYYCMGGNNPKLGYDLRAFLRKKENFLSEVKELNDKLLGAKQAFDYVTKLTPSFKPQLEQIEGELALVPKAREAIEKGFFTLTNIIKQNVGVRNKAFRDANEELFK